MCPHCKTEFPTATAMEKHQREQYRQTEEYVEYKRLLVEDFHPCEECPYEHCRRNGASVSKMRLVFGQGLT